MNKPLIIVLSSDKDEEFLWLSDGWFSKKNHDTKKSKESKRLKDLAEGTIKAAIDVLDAIRCLKEIGFDVERESNRESTFSLRTDFRG
jgi:hypothetical protein